MTIEKILALPQFAEQPGSNAEHDRRRGRGLRSTGRRFPHPRVWCRIARRIGVHFIKGRHDWAAIIEKAMAACHQSRSNWTVLPFPASTSSTLWINSTAMERLRRTDQRRAGAGIPGEQ